MQGFGEYAKLKGYNITFAMDASLPGKVGIKFVIMDAGVTVSTATVKKDVDEYINKMRNSDNLRDMPIVTDPIEHDRLVSVITMRFSYLKHEAELHAIQSLAYRRMFEDVQFMANRAIAYAPPPAQNLNIQVYNRGDSNSGGRARPRCVIGGAQKPSTPAPAWGGSRSTCCCPLPSSSAS
jgi:hypothetical protein